MQELRDQRLSADQQHLDADIRRSLKFSAHVTPQQHQAAKERLLRCASAQVPLEAVAPCPRPTLRDHAAVLRQHAVSFMNFLFVDSGAYERARRLPSHYRHYNVYGRYAFTIINMSA